MRYKITIARGFIVIDKHILIYYERTHFYCIRKSRNTCHKFFSASPFTYVILGN